MFAELAVSKSWRLKVIAISGCVYSSDRTRPTDQDIRIMYTLRIRINHVGPIKEEEPDNIKTGSDPGGVLMCKVLRVYVICISWSVGPVRSEEYTHPDLGARGPQLSRCSIVQGHWNRLVRQQLLI